MTKITPENMKKQYMIVGRGAGKSQYSRMNANDQVTVFKNRSEFDEFIGKVKEEGYMFGPEAIKSVN